MWNRAAAVDTYSFTLAPGAAYVVEANPAMPDGVPGVIIQAVVPGRRFSARTQLASTPSGPEKVVATAGGLCLVCSWWGTACTLAAGELQAVATSIKAPRRTRPPYAWPFIGALVATCVPGVRHRGCSSSLEFLMLTSRYPRSSSPRIVVTFGRS